MANKPVFGLAPKRMKFFGKCRNFCLVLTIDRKSIRIVGGREVDMKLQPSRWSQRQTVVIFFEIDICTGAAGAVRTIITAIIIIIDFRVRKTGASRGVVIF